LRSPCPCKKAKAQEGLIGGAIFGGAAGAIIGGAAGGCGGAAAGAIIGAATGAAPGAQMERRRTGFYWYKGRCWQRDPGATIIGCRAAIAVDPAKPRLTKAAQLQPSIAIAHARTAPSCHLAARC